MRIFIIALLCLFTLVGYKLGELHGWERLNEYVERNEEELRMALSNDVYDEWFNEGGIK